MGQNRNELPMTGKRSYDVWIRKFNNWNRGKNLTPFRFLHWLETAFDHLSPASRRLARSALLSSLERYFLKRRRVSRFSEFLMAARRVRIKQTRRDPQTITREQFLRLKDAATKRQRFILLGLWTTGGRVSEVLSVSLSRLQTHRDGRITAIVRGKGGSDVDLEYTAELFFKTRAFFRGVRFLYENEKTGQPFSVRSVEQYLQGLSRRVLGFPVTPHWIRHSVASDLYARTTDVKLVQDFLHHTSAKTTLDYYVRGKRDPSRALRTIAIEDTKRGGKKYVSKIHARPQGQRPGLSGKTRIHRAPRKARTRKGTSTLYAIEPESVG